MVEYGDGKGVPMTDEDGRGQVGAEESRVGPSRVTGHAPICSGQGATQHASDDDPRQFWHRPEVGVGPISTEGAHLKVRLREHR